MRDVRHSVIAMSPLKGSFQTSILKNDIKSGTFILATAMGWSL
jgi:hypothetical protein